MIAIDGLVAADLGVLEIDRLLLVDEQLDVVFERALIARCGRGLSRPWFCGRVPPPAQFRSRLRLRLPGSADCPSTAAENRPCARRSWRRFRPDIPWRRW